MISSITSILLVVTSTICEAFRRDNMILGYSSNRNIDKSNNQSNFRSFLKSNTIAFIESGSRSTPVVPMSKMKQFEYPVNDHHRRHSKNYNQRERRRYMIGTVVQKQSSELFCSAINPDNTSIDINNDNDSLITTNSTTSAAVVSWKEKLLQFSTIASILCVIDCTILPILTIILPLLGMVSAVNTILPYNHIIHHYGHYMTLYFVLPIGFFASTTNFLYNHRKKWITTIGWCGLFLILVANTGGGCGSMIEHVHTIHAPLHTQHHVVSEVVKHTSLVSLMLNGIITVMSTIRHTISHGIYHRITNLSGCALLIISNYISHQYQKKNHVHGKDCCTTPKSAKTISP